MAFQCTFFKRTLAAAACASALLTAPSSWAQSEASAAVSLLPVASVVGTASVVGGAASAAVALPAALLAGGAVLTVKAVEASARGTVVVLESASDIAGDSAAVSIELGAGAVASTALAVGTVVSTTVIASGVVLSAAGEVLCFIPNAVGEALLYNERLF
ncbi:hypothetical protein [Ottowia sp.]|uniref:hypothetical protein n=1 Tax=Ottowia sp. TaxID=1898956 RepID=UPI003A83ED52